MLSVLFGEAPDVFKQLLEFYASENARILDVTYGDGKLWSSINPEAQRRICM